MKIPQKIFGIAILVFFIMGSTILYSTYKLYGVSLEIKNLTEVFIPLSDQIAEIDIQIVEQELDVERFEKHIIEEKLIDEELRELAAGLVPAHLAATGKTPEQQIAFLQQQKERLIEKIKKEEVEFEEREKQVDAAIKRTEKLVEESVARNWTTQGRETLLSLIPVLKSIDLQHSNLHAQQAILLEAFRKDSPLQYELQELIEVEARELQDTVRTTWQMVAGFTEKAGHTAQEHESEALFVSVLLTIAAGILALIVSFFVIRGMMKPLRNLMAATNQVESGDLTGVIKSSTRDEIGDLTHSFNNMVEGLRKTEEIKDKFGQYVDPRVVSGLIGDPDMELVNGEKKVVSVFFSDLVNFTGISERFTPAGLVKLVNRYLTMMSEPITDNQGLIDKYIGDAIMAFWTTPFCKDGDQAGLAVEAALKDVKLIKILQDEMPELMGLRKDIPEIGMRIGIASGEALVGSIGSNTSKNYTVMGDTVNLGARLEGANKNYGTTILVCHRTFQMASGSFEFRKIDNILVIGKTEPIAIYEPLGPIGQVDEQDLAYRDQFELSLAAFHQGDWSAARKAFDNCLKTRAEDPAVQTYLHRLEAIDRDGAPDGWNGVWQLQSK
ncbi:MAG: adenylate/guanylate cyclase domain-containing protein [Rhizobiaceae bacterium]